MPPATTPGTTPPATTPAPVPNVPTANFTGNVADLAGLSVQFSNGSREGKARIDMSMRDVPRMLFANTGDFFGDTGAGLGLQLDILGFENEPGTIGLGDEMAVDRFSANFMDGNKVVRSFALGDVIIVAQKTRDANGNDTGASQDVVEVMWTIRFNDVATLVKADRVEIMLDDTMLSTAEIVGDVTINDAQGVSFVNVVNSI